MNFSKEFSVHNKLLIYLLIKKNKEEMLKKDKKKLNFFI